MISFSISIELDLCSKRFYKVFTNKQGSKQIYRYIQFYIFKIFK
jgi:hypothetical protein